MKRHHLLQALIFMALSTLAYSCVSPCRLSRPELQRVLKSRYGGDWTLFAVSPEVLRTERDDGYRWMRGAMGSVQKKFPDDQELKEYIDKYLEKAKLMYEGGLQDADLLAKYSRDVDEVYVYCRRVLDSDQSGYIIVFDGKITHKYGSSGWTPTGFSMPHDPVFKNWEQVQKITIEDLP